MLDDTIDFSAVNEVISVCKDAEAGFRTAADSVQTDPTLKNTFEEYARQRAKFAKELQEAVEEAGGVPEHSAGLAGKLHGGWIAIKGALTGNSEHELLVEAERGEDLSVHKYHDALAQPLPEKIRAILEEQYPDVELAHTHMKHLRDNTANA